MSCKNILKLEKDLSLEINKIEEGSVFVLKANKKLILNSDFILLCDERNIPLFSFQTKKIKYERKNKQENTEITGEIKIILDYPEKLLLAEIFNLEIEEKEEPEKEDYFTEEDYNYIESIKSRNDLLKVYKQILLFNNGKIKFLDIPNPLWASDLKITDKEGKKITGWDVYRLPIHKNFVLKEIDITLYKRYQSGYYNKDELKVLSPRIKHFRKQINCLQLVRDKISKVYSRASIFITSGYRSDNYGRLKGRYYHGLNGLIGGAKNSNHTKGKADDIDLKGMEKYLNITDRKIAEGLINVCRLIGCKRIELTSGVDHVVHVNFVDDVEWYAKQIKVNGRWSYPSVNPDKEWSYKFPKI